MKKIFIFISLFFIFDINLYAYSKSVVDITKMDIYEIQEAIDKGYLTYELLTKLYLERIEKYDGNFNSIITINKNAIEEAKKKDIEYQKYGRNSILFGIPIVVKDNIDVYGMPTTAGTKSLGESYPNTDSQVIKNLKDKGVIILAKTNMSEFAFMATSSISSYGVVKNAYETNYSSYGSSGGTAVAVSLSFALLGLGTDTNASIRVPASANNVIGFRPTFELLSSDGVINYDITRDTVGIITKTTKENAITLAVMEGKDEKTYINNIDKEKAFKLGVINDFFIGNSSGLYGTEKTDKDIVTLMKKVLTKIEDDNIEIIYLDDFYNSIYANVGINTQGGWTMCYAFNNYIKNTNSSLNNFYDLAYSKGHNYSLWDYVTDCGRDISSIEKYDEEKKDYRKYVEEIFNKYDLDFIIYPTTKNKVLKTDEKTKSFSSPSSLVAPILGYPAINISLGSINNLYYGMELVGLKNSEESLYQFASYYEKINPTYELSLLAPPLYEINDDVTNLINLYEHSLNLNIISNVNFFGVNTYQQVREEVEEFLFNYNDFSDEEITLKAQKLYNNYYDSITNINNYLIYFILGLLILIFIVLKLKRKH